MGITQLGALDDYISVENMEHLVFIHQGISQKYVQKKFKDYVTSKKIESVPQPQPQPQPSGRSGFLCRMGLCTSQAPPQGLVPISEDEAMNRAEEKAYRDPNAYWKNFVMVNRETAENLKYEFERALYRNYNGPWPEPKKKSGTPEGTAASPGNKPPASASERWRWTKPPPPFNQ